MLLRAKSALQVEIVFQSGSTQCFDINDGFLENVKLLLGAGLPPSEICKTWTRNSPGDPVRILRIVGKKADGSDVLMGSSVVRTMHLSLDKVAVTCPVSSDQ